jgi:hypothetical protein
VTQFEWLVIFREIVDVARLLPRRLRTIIIRRVIVIRTLLQILFLPFPSSASSQLEFVLVLLVLVA